VVNCFVPSTVLEVIQLLSNSCFSINKTQAQLLQPQQDTNTVAAVPARDKHSLQHKQDTNTVAAVLTRLKHSGYKTQRQLSGSDKKCK
jgi:hypothetical protein